MNIMHVMPQLAIGGMEVAAFNLINSLSECHHCLCFLYSEPKNYDLLRRIQKGSVEAFFLDKQEGIDLILPRKIARLSRQNEIDIIHARNFASLLYAGLSRFHFRGTKVIGDLRGIDLNYKRTAAYKILYRIGLVHRFVTVSKDIRARLRKTGFPERAIEVIHNGVDIDQIEDRQRNYARESANRFGVGKFVLGAVGRLEKVKNYQLLVLTLFDLLQSGHNVFLIVVGDGPERPALEGLVRNLNIEPAVSFLGYSDNVAEVMKSMHVLVSTSLSEGISNVILEAMASRLPVVASNVGGNPELVKHGVNGFLFDLDSKDDLYRGIERLVKKPEDGRRLGENGYLKVCSEYSLKTNAMKYHRLYSSLLR